MYKPSATTEVIRSNLRGPKFYFNWRNILPHPLRSSVVCMIDYPPTTQILYKTLHLQNTHVYAKNDCSEVIYVCFKTCSNILHMKPLKFVIQDESLGLYITGFIYYTKWFKSKRLIVNICLPSTGQLFTNTSMYMYM